MTFTKHFRRVEQLQEFSSSFSFIRSKSSVSVPQAQQLQDSNRLEKLRLKQAEQRGLQLQL